MRFSMKLVISLLILNLSTMFVESAPKKEKNSENDSNLQGRDSEKMKQDKLKRPPKVFPDFVTEDGRSEKEALETFGLSKKDFDFVQNVVFEMKKEDAIKAGREPPSDEELGNDITYRGILMTPEQLKEGFPDFASIGDQADSESKSDSKPETYEKVNMNGRENRRKRKVRNYHLYPIMQWDTSINYAFSGSQSDDDIIMIRGAMAVWESKTCLRFSESNTGAYLYFETGNSGCWSFIGKMVTDGPQFINLQTSACTSFLGTPVHEIGHAIGLVHEHARHDRSDHVTINNNNVKTDFLSNFDREIDTTTEHYHIEYDHGSVMHYTSGDFPITFGENTITTIDPAHQRTIGQRVDLSWHDAKAINVAYCNDTCSGVDSLDCKHGSYMDPNTCTSCVCPEGLGGTLCDEAAGNNGACETAPATDSTVYLNSTDEYCISSRNYGTGTYDDGDTCSYLVTAPEGCTIEARFDGNFGTYCYRESTYPTCYQWVEIKTSADLSSRGSRFCCSDSKSDVVVSESNRMLIDFNAEYPKVSNAYSSGQVPSTSDKTGFKVCYQLADSACTLTTRPALDPTPTLARTPQSKTTTAPAPEPTTTVLGLNPGCGVPLVAMTLPTNLRYPLSDYYDNNIQCEWDIVVPSGKAIKLEFIAFDVEESSTCRYDDLSIIDKAQPTTVIAKLCGTNLPPSITEHRNLTLTFKTDFSVIRAGFDVRITSI